MDMRTGNEPLHKGYRIIQLLFLLIICALLFIGIAHYSHNRFFSQPADHQAHDYRRSRPALKPESKEETPAPVLSSLLDLPELNLASVPSVADLPKGLPVKTELPASQTYFSGSVPAVGFVSTPNSSAMASGKIGTMSLIMVLHHVHKDKTHPLASKEDYQALLPKIKAATARVGAANDFFLILDGSVMDLKARPYLFVTGEVTDVTQLVIAELEAEPQVVSK